MAEVERVVAFFNKKSKSPSRPTPPSSAVRPSTSMARRSPMRRWPRRRQADAVMFGAVGGPKWDKVPYASGPRPASCACARSSTCSPTCAPRSAMRRSPRPPRSGASMVEGLDILILRELTGGTYFGEPKEIVTLENGEKRAVDTTALYHARDRAHRPRRLRSRPQAQEQGALGRQAQRHGNRRAVARGRHRHARARGQGRGARSTSWPITAPCSWCATPSSSTSSSPTTCSATCCPTRPPC